MTTTDAYNYPPANKHVEIDIPTGLPKLSIELLPDTEPEEYGTSHRKHSLRIDRMYVHPADMAGKVSTVCVYVQLCVLLVNTPCAILEHSTAWIEMFVQVNHAWWVLGNWQYTLALKPTL